MNAARRLLGRRSSAVGAGPTTTVAAPDSKTDRRGSKDRAVGFLADDDDSKTGRRRRSGFVGSTGNTVRVSNIDLSRRKSATAAAALPEVARVAAPTTPAAAGTGEREGAETGAGASAGSTLPTSTETEKVRRSRRSSSSSNSGRSSSNTGRRGKPDAGSGRNRQLDEEAGNFYRAALSTHISWIATTPADDPPSSGSSQCGGISQEEGSVGKACRALQGDVAGVRQVRERRVDGGSVCGGNDKQPIFPNCLF